MAYVTRGRVVAANQTVLDQADFFQLDGYTRVFGLTPSDVVATLFHDNVLQPWTFVTGLGVTDAQVVSGKVYFHEIPGSPGYYSVRWRPLGTGYWRLLLDYGAGMQIVAQDYDVGAVPLPPERSIKASLIKPTC